MIVRISTEGQYRLPETHEQRLAKLDNEAVAAVEAGDEQLFYDLFRQMLNLVREDGEKLDIEELAASDVILPPPDIPFEHAKADFTGEGLIPD